MNPETATTFAELAAARTESLNSKIAYHWQGEENVSITYSELGRQARCVAAHLLRTCQPGDRVVLVYPPSIDFIVGFLGCLYAGMWAVPLCPPRRRRQSDLVDGILQAADAAVVLSTHELADEAVEAYSLIPGLKETPWLATDRLEELGDRFDPPGWKPSDIAFIQFTSGSTSNPRGVMVTHDNLLRNLYAMQQGFKMSADTDYGVSWLPMYHDMGLIGVVLQTVYSGGTTTLLSPSAFAHRPLLWLETIAARNATISGGPNFAYDWCVREASAEALKSLDLSRWRVAFTGAEPIRAETLNRFSETFGPCGFRPEAFLTCYGLAESTLMVSCGHPAERPATLVVEEDSLAQNSQVGLADAHTQEATRTLVSSGRIAGQEVHIVNLQTQAPCPAGEIGEIWVSGPSVAGGYFGNDAASKATYCCSLPESDLKFMRTGDLGFHHDGELYVTGRLKDLLIIRGRNVYPQDVEFSIEAVDDAIRPGTVAAFSVELADEERLVVVQEVTRTMRGMDLKELIQRIRAAVADEHGLEVFAISLVKLGELPRTTSGKLRRSVCKQHYLSNSLKTVETWFQKLSAAGVAPPAASQRSKYSRQRIEQWLVQELAARCDIDALEIDIEMPFFSLGLTSAQTTSLTVALEQWLGRELSPTFFFSYPTVGLLAQYLGGGFQEHAEAENSSTREDNLLDEVASLTESELESLIDTEMLKLT